MVIGRGVEREMAEGWGRPAAAPRGGGGLRPAAAGGRPLSTTWAAFQFSNVKARYNNESGLGYSKEMNSPMNMFRQ